MKKKQKNFVRKTYEHWIKKNRHRFIYEPWISRSRRDRFTLRFTGIAPELTCDISDSGINVSICSSHGEIWDLLTDFDTIVKKTTDGQYYCQLCDDYDDGKTLTYYSSPAALWEEHVFEEMLEWINALSSDKLLHIYCSSDEGCCVAKITAAFDMNRELGADWHHISFPIVTAKEAQTGKPRCAPRTLGSDIFKQLINQSEMGE